MDSCLLGIRVTNYGEEKLPNHPNNKINTAMLETVKPKLTFCRKKGDARLRIT